MPNLFRLEDNSYLITSDLITKKQLMEEIGKCRATIQLWQRKGLPYTRFKNQRNGYDLAEVDRWLIDNGYPCVKLLQKWRLDNKE